MNTRILFLTVCCVILAVAAPKATAQPSQTPTINQEQYQVQILPAMDNTWSYMLLIGSKYRIHQYQIPGEPVKGFKTQQEAEEAAQAAIGKIKAGLFPDLRLTEQRQPVSKEKS